MNKYERVVDYFRSQIASGQLRPGDRLPSTAQLLQQLGVSYTTLRDAKLVLKAEGLIVGQPGDGVFVARNQDKGARHGPTD